MRSEAGVDVAVATVAGRNDNVPDVIGVVAQILPWNAVGVLCEHCVDHGDVCRCVNISDIGAEVEEVVIAFGGLPTKLLPSAGL